MNERQLFLKHLAPTTLEPMAFPISKAAGNLLYDNFNNSYIDLIGGISVANMGHGHPAIIAATQQQVAKYMHVMVYGEAILTPQVAYAQLLTQHLPAHLNNVYFTNSGAEAVEGAMKLAKRATGRSKIVSCKNSYHGSTQGAMSIFGDTNWTQAYRPLLPGIIQIRHNNIEDLQYITHDTACIILEVIQAEGGVLIPDIAWLMALREKCTATGTLLILDEIQTGFGRTGTLWAFEQFGIHPDVLLLGKALGGGMPMGAFIADIQLMQTMAVNPILGHMTTFGGHPVCCAAGMAAMQVLLNENILPAVHTKGAYFKSLLIHPQIKAVRQIGLMIAVELADFDTLQQFIKLACIQYINKDHGQQAPVGIFTDWFLFNSYSFRIVPPLTITTAEIEKACQLIQQALNQL